MVSKHFVAAVLAAVLAGPAMAADPAADAHGKPPQRGVDGLVAVPVSVLNAGAEATIVCGTSIAHWYSQELGRISPGVALEVTLWADPSSGALYMLNWHADRMPVERLWCGLEGKAWATRAPIEFARRAGAAQPPVRLGCTTAPAGDRLVCTPR